jgi:hypothetical protein
MYTEPSHYLDQELLIEYHSQIVAKKLRALDEAGIQNPTEVRSNPQFAEALKRVGVDPPMKIIPTTGLETFAFAKTDQGLQDLANDDDIRVQALVAARLENKSTLAESRAESFIEAARYGEFPVSYLYSGAQTTHRLSGCLVAESEIFVYDWRQARALTKRIVDVLPDDLVWDGLEFVKHGGIKFSGYRTVTEYCGLVGTPEHRVFLADGGQSTLADAKAQGLNLAVSNSPTEDQMAAAKTRALT